MLRCLNTFRYFGIIAIAIIFCGSVRTYAQYYTIQKYSAEGGVKASGDEQ